MLRSFIPMIFVAALIACDSGETPMVASRTDAGTARDSGNTATTTTDGSTGTPDDATVTNDAGASTDGDGAVDGTTMMDGSVATDGGAETADAALSDCQELNTAGGCPGNPALETCVCRLVGVEACCTAASGGAADLGGWSSACALIARDPACTSTNCCTEHLSGGCNDRAIQNQVCNTQPECCLSYDPSDPNRTGWTGICVAAADEAGANCAN